MYKRDIYKIVSNEPLTPAVSRMVLEGDTQYITRSGQFVNIELEGKFLRRPISVADYDERTITIIYKVVGSGTRQMQQMEAFKIGENPDADLERNSEIAATDELKDKIENFDHTAETANDEVIVENEMTEPDVISRDIITRNESLKGDVHPITGVPFEEKTVTDAEGNKVTGVFPEFDSQFDAQLPDDMLQASDAEQFGECNKQLKEAVDNEEKGKMQLVDSETHARTGHTGGRSIWGGGSEFR